MFCLEEVKKPVEEVLFAAEAVALYQIKVNQYRPGHSRGKWLKRPRVVAASNSEAGTNSATESGINSSTIAVGMQVQQSKAVVAAAPAAKEAATAFGRPAPAALEADGRPAPTADRQQKTIPQVGDFSSVKQRKQFKRKMAVFLRSGHYDLLDSAVQQHSMHLLSTVTVGSL